MPLARLNALRMPGAITAELVRLVVAPATTASVDVHTDSSITLNVGAASQIRLPPAANDVVVASLPAAFFALGVIVVPALACRVNAGDSSILIGTLAWMPGAPVPMPFFSSPLGMIAERRGATAT